MKNTSTFFLEAGITLIVAFLLSSLAVVIISFIAGNIGIYYTSLPTIGFTGGVVFGLVFGYKLSTLVRLHKK